MDELMQANLQVIELLQVILQEVERCGVRRTSGEARGMPLDGRRGSPADNQTCH